MFPLSLTPNRPAWVSVDLSAIRSNLASVCEWVGPDVGVMAVVKANAYGHGLVRASLAALEGGAMGLGVAIVEEGIALRNAGVTERILVMGISEPRAAAAIVRRQLDAAVCTRELLAALSHEAVQHGLPARVHVKIDSGMGRVGLLPHEAEPFLDAVAGAPGVEWAGLMTHFATADEDLDYTAEQWRRFRAVLEPSLCVRRDARPLWLHAANSAATCRFTEAFEGLPDGVYPVVRAGLLTYGIPPAPRGPCPALKPAICLMARVTQARDVPAGIHVSYGSTFTTTRASRLAIVPLGYADGYSRANSNRASVLLRGRRVPVLGRVCMDQFVVDATDTGAEIGDEIVLIGRQGGDEITVQDVADWGGTIHHEVLTRLSTRLPREYVGGNDVR
jgi:alanine racemase